MPVGSGPSGKRGPRWAAQVPHWTSTRRIPNDRSSWVTTLPFSTTSKKLGQPVPDSNFVPESKSGVLQTTQRYVPSPWKSQYAPVNARSVWPSWVTAYWSGPSSRLRASRSCSGTIARSAADACASSFRSMARSGPAEDALRPPRLIRREGNHHARSVHACRHRRFDVDSRVGELAGGFGQRARPVHERGGRDLDFAGFEPAFAQRRSRSALVAGQQRNGAAAARCDPTEAGDVDPLAGDRLGHPGELTRLVIELHDEEVHDALLDDVRLG